MYFLGDIEAKTTSFQDGRLKSPLVGLHSNFIGWLINFYMMTIFDMWVTSGYKQVKIFVESIEYTMLQKRWN